MAALQRGLFFRFLTAVAGYKRSVADADYICFLFAYGLGWALVEKASYDG